MIAYFLYDPLQRSFSTWAPEVYPLILIRQTVYHP